MPELQAENKHSVSVEIASAALLVWVYARFGLSIELLGYGFFCLALLAIFVIDLKTRLIPDRVTYPSIVVGIIFALLARQIVPGLIGMVLGFCLLLFVALVGRLIFRKDAMGGGDIKLAAMVGMFLGWKLLLVGLFLAFLMGAVVGGIAMATGKKKRGSEIAFGPFIAVGSVLALFWGMKLLNLYLYFAFK
jgi:leader peptidase (prepilin peptidase)/N-methyltransferase